jgi:uncharacterized protein YneF (UPF0154 family)
MIEALLAVVLVVILSIIIGIAIGVIELVEWIFNYLEDR